VDRCNRTTLPATDRSHVESFHYGGCGGERGGQAGGHVVQAVVSCAGCRGEWFVHAVARVDEADVVVLAVEAAKGGLVVQPEPVRTDAPGACR